MAQKNFDWIWWVALGALFIIALREGWAGELVLRIGAFFVFGVVVFLIAYFFKNIFYKAKVKSDAAILSSSGTDHSSVCVDLLKQGKSYQECLKYLLSQGVGKATAEQIIGNAVVELKDRDHALVTPAQGEDPLGQLLGETYDAWKAGALARFSEAFVTETLTKTRSKFIDDYRRMLGTRALDSLKMDSLKIGEILVVFLDGSFLVTSERLYAFHPRLPSPRNLWLSEIDQYSAKGVWAGTVTIRMRSGEIIVLKNLDQFPDGKYVQGLIDQKKGKTA